MEPFDSIEKLITEHGSAAVLQIWNDKLRNEALLLEQRLSELQAKIRDLEAQLAAAHEQIGALNNLHEEDKRLYRGIEFRSGRRTGRVWMPYCPKCGLPVNDTVMAKGDRWALCSSHCGWVGVPIDREMDSLIAELKE